MGGPPTLFSKAWNALRVLYPLVLAYLLFGMDLYRTLGLAPDVAAWVYLGLVVAFYAAPGMVEYPLRTVGKARRVTREPIEEGDARHCSVCGATTEGGERREYAEQWVLFGVPLTNVDWGTNDYCSECAGPTSVAPDVDPGTEVFDEDRIEEATDEEVSRVVENETDVETERS